MGSNGKSVYCLRFAYSAYGELTGITDGTGGSLVNGEDGKITSSMISGTVLQYGYQTIHQPGYFNRGYHKQPEPEPLQLRTGKSREQYRPLRAVSVRILKP